MSIPGRLPTSVQRKAAKAQRNAENAKHGLIKFRFATADRSGRPFRLKRGRGVALGGIVNKSYISYLPYLHVCERLCADGRNIMNTAYVTSKGQLVVPSRIRRRFGIKPGTRVNFVEEGDRIIFQPVTREYIDSFCGIFKQKPGEKSVVQELLEERRAEKEKEDRE